MATQTRTNISSRNRHIFHQYTAIDGGSGAHLLAALDGYSPYLQSVASSRHADLLIIVAPISQELIPAIAEIAGSLPQPAHVLIVETPSSELASFPALDIANSEILFSGVRKVTASSASEVFHAITDPSPWAKLAVNLVSIPDTETIQLPPKQEQEMATELVVLSLGPVQPFTSGPLRVFLICDGEQVFSAQVASGYAHRGIAQAMLQADWQQALELASVFDPLSPVASRLAYVQAIEHLQDWYPDTQIALLREAALALERAQNHLWWLVRFLRLLSEAQLSDRAYQLATAYEANVMHLWQQPPSIWIQPQSQGNIAYNASAVPQVQQLAIGLETLTRSIERNRWLKLRTRDIGVLAASYLKEHGVSGPVLQASELGQGDVQSRLLARLHNVVADMRMATDVLTRKAISPSHAPQWDVPTGEAQITIEGARGQMSLHLKSDGREKLSHAMWQSSSGSLLPLLPEILAGQKLADAETILASLDLAIAEVDG